MKIMLFLFKTYTPFNMKHFFNILYPTLTSVINKIMQQSKHTNIFTQHALDGKN